MSVLGIRRIAVLVALLVVGVGSLSACGGGPVGRYSLFATAKCLRAAGYWVYAGKSPSGRPSRWIYYDSKRHFGGGTLGFMPSHKWAVTEADRLSPAGMDEENDSPVFSAIGNSNVISDGSPGDVPGCLRRGSGRGPIGLAPHQPVSVGDNPVPGVARRSGVIDFVGRPAAETRGRYANYAPFDALGYGCAGHATTPTGLPECETVYYIVRRTRRLALVFTRDPSYAYKRVRAGTPYRVATLHAHDLSEFGVRPGCNAVRKAFDTGVYAEFFNPGPNGDGFPGGTPARSGDLRNSYVGFLAVGTQGVSAWNFPPRRNNPGVLECIDR